jgi:hypothetical protein
MPLSAHPYLTYLATLLATAGTIISLKFILKPGSAVEYFELDAPKADAQQRTAHAFVTLYAIRNLYMAGAVYAALYHNHRPLLGVLLVLCGVVAGLDGLVANKYAGRGAWNHWRMIPVFVGIGSVAMGLLD